MYQYEDIKVIHLEITSKCQASCPMCPRNIQGGVDNPFMELREITFDQFKIWFPVDFIQQLDRLYMCGNLGDPIIAKDTLEIFAYLRQTNPNIHLSMNTNGSARNSSWWQQLAEHRVQVRFGIDGLEDTHSLYRINTDFNKIITNAQAFIQAGGHAVWDMLVFDHNKHQIGACQHMADQLGFKEFFSKNTSRFKDNKLDVLDKAGKTRYVLFATERSKEMAKKSVDAVQSKQGVQITCKVQNEGHMYVSASGNVTPCCWLDMEFMPPHSFSRIDYMNTIGKFMNLQSYQLKEIFSSGFFKEISDTWSCNPLKECSKQCGQFDKFGEQFK